LPCKSAGEYVFVDLALSTNPTQKNKKAAHRETINLTVEPIRLGVLKSFMD
jgi:hypothetical protein